MGGAMGKSINLDELDKVLEKWNWAKAEEAAMKKKVEECKTKIEAAMAKMDVTEITTKKYSITKRMQSREFVSKKDMPNEVWKKYAKTTEFPVLSFKKAAGAKAKAKAKVKGKGK